ncbi:hypothetical protein LguiB_004341 [Lonicera macranthoides]
MIFYFFTTVLESRRQFLPPPATRVLAIIYVQCKNKSALRSTFLIGCEFGAKIYLHQDLYH